LAGKAFVVNVDQLRVVDECGRKLLSRWHGQGANLTGTSARARLLIESITGHAVPRVSPGPASPLAWNTFRAATILSIVLLTLVLPSTVWADPSTRDAMGQANLLTSEAITNVFTEIAALG